MIALHEASVGWVKAATSAKGLDHLGSIAPCIGIYSALLPGMTNVTDRARYYSFYPWFLWKYGQSGEPIESTRFHELYRRADCLFTLIAEYHGTVSGGDPGSHGGGLIGGRKLIPALNELKGNKSLRLSDYATQEEQESRYFQNRLGGLGQYYLGTLEVLGILSGRKGEFVQYDPIVGREIAQRFDAGVSDADVNTIRRRQSLGLILHLTREITSDPDAGIDVDTFRDACYSGSLPSGKPWIIPDSLSEIRDHWRLYERNELLSISAQALLTIFVRSLELLPQAPASANEVAKFLLSSPGLRRVAKRGWQQFVDDCGKTLPDLNDFLQASHELSLAKDLLKLGPAASSVVELAGAVQRILSILAALALRTDSAAGPYCNLPIMEAFLADYPINLASFEQATVLWRGMSIGQVVEWLIREWACETHLRIALRKLRYEHSDTFRFYPTESGLKPCQVPAFAYSNPRVRQALQMLRDIGALKADKDGRFQITASGSRWLEEVCLS